MARWLAVALALAASACEHHAGTTPPPGGGSPDSGVPGTGGGGDDGGPPTPPPDMALPPSTSIAWWLTTPDESKKLAPQTPLDIVAAPSAGQTIVLDPSQAHQTMTGFGASLTDSSAWVLSHKMSDAQRADAMAALFGGDPGIAVGVLRQPMGTSDLAWSYYSYDDVAAGQTDPNLTSFSIARDQSYIIPMLLSARKTNPGLQIIATPWSAPAWMKTNGSLLNTGSLIDPTSYPVYAQYFVRFVQAYQAAGVPIWAVTPLNEPLIQPVGYPSMSMQWYQEGNFVRYHLGPAFAAAGIKSKILVFDHNWDNVSFPKQLLDDNADVRGYTGGVAFHCYGGDPSAMDTIHTAYPDLDIYVTECSGGTWTGSFADSLLDQVQRLYIGSVRHWARSIVRWNLALDDAHGPFPTGSHGCDTCIGLITVHDDGSFTREVDYYAMGHTSRFVRPGARRIDSNTFGDGNIEDVAYVNPDGGRVLVVLNSGGGARSFAVTDGARGFVANVPGGAVATFTWR